MHTALIRRSLNVYESNTFMSAKVLLKRLFNLLYLNVHNLELVHTCLPRNQKVDFLFLENIVAYRRGQLTLLTELAKAEYHVTSLSVCGLS